MIRGIWVALVMLVTTVVLGTVAMVAAFVQPSGGAVMRLARLWSSSAIRAAGLRATIVGLERVPDTGPCIFLANHQSIADIWLTILVVPLSTRIVAKRSLFRIPVFGWALTICGFIPIDRANRTRALQSLARAAESVRRGRSLVMYPEGTRSRDGRLQPFKKGAFHLALQAGVPVIPMSIRGTFHAFPPRTLLVRPGDVEVVVHPAVDTRAYQPANLEGLMTAVRETIASGLEGPLADADRRAAGGGES